MVSELATHPRSFGNLTKKGVIGIETPSYLAGLQAGRCTVRLLRLSCSKKSGSVTIYVPR
jgi:hypothetical protein